ncbi:MAG: VTT domain-containing protein [Actinomycetota bacterium]|nr:VTT domain-containing protein [Actinomycetota bacterium]
MAQQTIAEAKRCLDSTCCVDYEVVPGGQREGLVNAARRHAADVIVLPPRPGGRLRAELSGRLASKVAVRGSLRLTLLVAPLLALALTVAIAGPPSGAAIRRGVDAAGPAAPVAFVGSYVAWTALMLPGSIAPLAAGACFGFALGGTLSLVGAEIGAVAAYLLARRVARRAAVPRAARLARPLNGSGFAALLSARLMPGVPFNALNYAAGATTIRADGAHRHKRGTSDARPAPGVAKLMLNGASSPRR